MKQAIHPNYFKQVEEINALKEKEAGEQPSIEEKALYDLSFSKGWKILDEFIKDIEKDLDSLTLRQVEQGLGFDEIGRSTVVKEITKDVIRRIRNRVNDARDAGERKAAGGGEKP